MPLPPLNSGAGTHGQQRPRVFCSPGLAVGWETAWVYASSAGPVHMPVGCPDFARQPTEIEWAFRDLAGDVGCG